ncbi:hypothetical protein STA3757_02380 [Stanieria sp. NIES-3757]|nr:hypothetical protein STA3757_02380 [Stanieria sp. NIES-3757]
MNSKSKIWLNLLKTCTPIALFFSTMIGTELVANARPPHIPLPASNPNSSIYFGRINSPTPPSSLNVTPNPLRQNYYDSYYNSSPYYYSDYYYNEGNYFRVKRGRVDNSTLINPTIINSDISDSVIIDPVIINPKTRIYRNPGVNRSYIRVRFE